MSTVWKKARFIAIDTDGNPSVTDNEQDVKDILSEGGAAVEIAEDGTVAQLDEDLEPLELPTL